MLHIITVLASIPVTIYMAHLTTKYSTATLLIYFSTLVVLSGTLMISSVKETDSWLFMIGYLISQTINSSNFVLSNTMLMSRLQP